MVDEFHKSMPGETIAEVCCQLSTRSRVAVSEERQIEDRQTHFVASILISTSLAVAKERDT